MNSRPVRFAVGIDLVHSAGIAASIEEHGERYLRRVYTEGELAECGRDPLRLAARFAAKEAAMKALQRADEGFAWSDIEVVRAADGSPSLRLAGAAGRLADARGISEFEVSLTHDGDYAAAVVLAIGT